MWDWDSETGAHTGTYSVPCRQESEKPKPKDIYGSQLNLKEAYHREDLKYSHFRREEIAELTADPEGTRNTCEAECIR